MVFAGDSLPAWYASRPSSMSVTYLALFTAGLTAFQVHVFLYVPWYAPAPTETLTAALTWACVRSEQASSGGAALAGAATAPAMKMAAITAPRLIFEGMSQDSLADGVAYSTAECSPRKLTFPIRSPKPARRLG